MEAQGGAAPLFLEAQPPLNVKLPKIFLNAITLLKICELISIFVHNTISCYSWHNLMFSRISKNELE